MKVWAVGILATISVLAYWTDTWANTESLYYRAHYDELPGGDLQSIVTRAVLLTVGIVGAWAFLALVPRLGGWFSRMGAWTLVVYLFHGFAIKTPSTPATWAGRPTTRWSRSCSPPSWPGSLALLLAWRPVAERLNVVVDPVGFAKHEVRTAHHLQAATVRADDIAAAVQEAAEQQEPAAPASTPAEGLPRNFRGTPLPEAPSR